MPYAGLAPHYLATMAFRVDIGKLRPAKRLKDGRLQMDAYFTRAGIFEYQEPNGRIRRELRPREEVFHRDSMSSFGLVPVTNNHPPSLIDARNARDYMVGSTGETVTREDDLLRGVMMVADSDTARQVEAGKQEVSCGYSCDIDETPGEHPLWGRYDAIQRNIRGNHVAIVDSARAGQTARVRLDGAATQLPSVPVRENRSNSMDPEELQKTIRSLGAQLTEAKERADSAVTTMKEAVTRADVAEGKLLTAEARVSELQAQVAARMDAGESALVAAEKKRADDAEAKVARFDAVLERRVRERAKLEKEAVVVMGPDFRMDDLSDREIRCAVVQRLDATADVSKSVSDGIITGRFLSLLEGHSKNARSQARIAEALAASDEGSVRTDAKEIQKQKIRDQWKQPLPNDIRANAGKV